MNEKSANILELPKILDQLAKYASFSAGEELVRQLAPTDDIRIAQGWQQETTEARTLFEVKTEISMGGAHDVRPAAISGDAGALC